MDAISLHHNKKQTIATNKTKYTVMKKMIVIALASLFTLAATASNKDAAAPEVKTTVSTSGVLKGNVYDKNTNESLAGAVITANGQKVYTDLDGNFSIQNVCNGKCQLKISLISYEDQTIEVDTNSSKSVQIKLSQR